MKEPKYSSKDIIEKELINESNERFLGVKKGEKLCKNSVPNKWAIILKDYFLILQITLTLTFLFILLFNTNTIC